MTCRLLASPSAVTVQVLTTHRSAGSSSAASRKPAVANDWRTNSVSYWLTLQPSVTVLSVAMVNASRGESRMTNDTAPRGPAYSGTGSMLADMEPLQLAIRASLPKA